MLCCHYHVVNMVSNCPFDCTYCYLQTYLNQPMTTFYVNEEDIFSQVRALCARPPVKQLRVGTGELSDSLALDPITGFSERLAAVMGEFENVRLELKTKSKNVEHLLGIERKDHVVIAWSMNPPEIVDAEEHGTARFEERVRAAAIAAAAGFKVAFHFDPMILTEGWQELYERAATHLLERVPHEAIQWISIGGLRYQPQLKPIALRRRPATTLFADETTPGSDGKIRYLRTQRTEMFQFLNGIIKSRAPGLYTYLCMESMPVWEKALGRMPDRGF
jgi:spore photoproduct lyase